MIIDNVQHFCYYNLQEVIIMDNEENNKHGFGYFMFHASKRPELYNQVGRILYREAGVQSAEPVWESNYC